MAFRLLSHLDVEVSAHRPGALWDSGSLPGCSLLSHLCLRPERGESDFCFLRPGWGECQRATPMQSCHPHPLLQALRFLRGPLPGMSSCCVTSPGWVGGMELGGLEALQPWQVSPGAGRLTDVLPCTVSEPGVCLHCPRACFQWTHLNLIFSTSKMSQKLSPLVSPPGLLLSGIL